MIFTTVHLAYSTSTADWTLDQGHRESSTVNTQESSFREIHTKPNRYLSSSWSKYDFIL